MKLDYTIIPTDINGEKINVIDKDKEMVFLGYYTGVVSLATVIYFVPLIIQTTVETIAKIQL